MAIDRVMNEDIPDIRSDNLNGGIIATERLIQQGARHIIHTNGPIDVNTPANLRQTGYEQTMHKHGLSPVTYTVDFSLGYEEKSAIFNRIFQEHPNVDGIFASNDTDAIQIYHLAQVLGKRLPDDLKLIGYDGTQLMRYMHPYLTTIIQPISQIADKAIDILEQRIHNKATHQEYIFPVELHEGTTG